MNKHTTINDKTSTMENPTQFTRNEIILDTYNAMSSWKIMGQLLHECGLESSSALFEYDYDSLLRPESRNWLNIVKYENEFGAKHDRSREVYLGHLRVVLAYLKKYYLFALPNEITRRRAHLKLYAVETATEMESMPSVSG